MRKEIIKDEIYLEEELLSFGFRKKQNCYFYSQKFKEYRFDVFLQNQNEIETRLVYLPDQSENLFYEVNALDHSTPLMMKIDSLLEEIRYVCFIRKENDNYGNKKIFSK